MSKKLQTLPSQRSFLISVSLETGIYRHIRISAEETLERLHSAILDAFQFDDDHAHAFFMDNQTWSDADSYYCDSLDDDEDRYTKDYQLISLSLEIGKRFKYVFDFGDCWEFQLKVLKILDEETEFPLVVRRAGEAPSQYGDDDEEFEDEDEDEYDDDDDL